MHIKKIVYFGFYSKEHDGRGAVYMQHLLLRDIVSKLNQIYGNDTGSGSIQIIAQNRHYTNDDKTIAKDLLPRITFVDEPQGFLEIDSETLVIGLSAQEDGIPFRQIIADLASASRGAAPVGISWTEWGGLDPNSPRVDSMLEEFVVSQKFGGMECAELAASVSVLYLKKEIGE